MFCGKRNTSWLVLIKYQFVWIFVYILFNVSFTGLLPRTLRSNSLCQPTLVCGGCFQSMQTIPQGEDFKEGKNVVWMATRWICLVLNYWSVFHSGQWLCPVDVTLSYVCLLQHLVSFLPNKWWWQIMYGGPRHGSTHCNRLAFCNLCSS